MITSSDPDYLESFISSDQSHVSLFGNDVEYYIAYDRFTLDGDTLVISSDVLAELEVDEGEYTIVLDYYGDGFLNHMVRLLTGELEKTNEAYALAKISGLKYCEFLNRQYGTDFISVMPTNLYGPNDNYHPTHSHVLPALIRRFHEAKVEGRESVTCWGDGSPLREFLYVDDLADLCVFLMNHYNGNETVNAGTGKEISIRQLAEIVADVVGYQGKILWDTSKPNGTPRKLLDVSKAKQMGWTYQTELQDGIRLTYEDFLANPQRMM